MNLNLIQPYQKLPTDFDHEILFEICENNEKYAWAKDGCYDFVLKYWQDTLAGARAMVNENIVSGDTDFSGYWEEKVDIYHERIEYMKRITPLQWWENIRDGKITLVTLGQRVAMNYADKMIEELAKLEKDVE